jgi:hypothetical protein
MKRRIEDAADSNKSSFISQLINEGSLYIQNNLLIVQYLR